MMRFLKRLLPNIYIGLALFFIYLPIVVLIVFSFNKVPKSFNWGGFSIEGYTSLFQGPSGVPLFNALLTTLKIAAIASVVATLFGVVSCLGIAYLRKRFQNLIMNVTYIPNIMPELVLGIAFMLLFAFLNIQRGELTLILAHIAFCVPFAILSISPKMKQLDKNLAEAAMDLGATQWQTIRLVIIPELMPGILSALMLTFTLSVDDYLISAFNAGSSIQTLPMEIYSQTKLGVNPKLNALTTILFIVIFALLFLSNLSSLKKDSKKEKS